DGGEGAGQGAFEAPAGGGRVQLGGIDVLAEEIDVYQVDERAVRIVSPGVAEEMEEVPGWREGTGAWDAGDAGDAGAEELLIGGRGGPGEPAGVAVELDCQGKLGM